MKKIGLILIVIGASILIGVSFGKIIRDSKAGADANLPPLNTSTEFVWGIHSGAYALNKVNEGYNLSNVNKQLNSLKELGVNLARFNLEIQKSQDPFAITPIDSTNDDFINKIHDNGQEILLVIDPDVPSTIGKADYEKEGYQLGSYAAKRYGDKVKFFQIANEISGTIAKKPDYQGEIIKGENGIDYSQESYDTTLGWIKGLSKGIRENAPSAKIILSGHWVLYDIFPKLINDGADFDILGWSWYSSDGTDITQREYNYGHYMDLADKLYSIKKDVWIVESNASGGSQPEGLGEWEGEEAQAKFFKDFLTSVYSTGKIKGFIVFTLFDSPASIDLNSENDAHFGLVEAKKINDEIKTTKNKKAFQIYQQFIKDHKLLPSALITQ